MKPAGGHRQDRSAAPPSHNHDVGVREELEFQFDEDLDVPTGRHNKFTDWSVDIC